jgi:hypothetical protein
MSWFKSPAFWVILASISIAVAANMGEQGGYLSGSSLQARAEDRPSLAKMAGEPTILREGTILHELKGRFRKQGERYFFTEEGKSTSYKCLENLCLERIVSTEDRKLVWLVSAKVLEFNDENYFILEKAVRTR